MFSKNTSNLQNINDQITKAESYYWLGLEEEGNLEPLKEGLKLLSQAEEKLKKEKNQNKEILRKITALKQDFEFQIEMAHDAFEGVFPLKKLFTKTFFLDADIYNTYELIDESDVKAIKYAATKLAKNIAECKVKVPTYETIFISKSKNRLLENEALYVFNKNSRFYVHNFKEISTVLSKKELELIYEGKITRNILEKFQNYFKYKNLLIIYLEKQKFTKNKLFYTALGKYYGSLETKPEFLSTSMGFSRDLNHMLIPVISTYFFLLVLSIILYFLLKDNSDSKNINLQKHLPISISAFITGTVFPYFIISLTEPLSPPADNLAILSFWWPVLTCLIIFYLPFFVYKITMKRLKTTFLYEYSEVLFLSVSFGITAFFTIPFLLIKEMDGFYFIISFLVIISLSSFLLARSLKIKDIKVRKRYSILSFIIHLSLASICFTLNFNYFIILSFFTLLSVALTIKFFSAKNIDFNKISQEETVFENQSNLNLSQRIKSPKYIKFEHFNKANKCLSEKRIVALQGLSGRGKTALGMALYNNSKTKKTILLKGFCNDNIGQKNTQIPFEAFHDILSNKLSINIVPKNLESENNLDNIMDTLLNSVIPIAGMILPARNGENREGSIKEIQVSVFNLLKNIETKCEKITIFLDDIQWIDKESKELLQFLITKIQSSELSKTEVILASRNLDIYQELDLGNYIIEVKELNNEDKLKLLSESLQISEKIAKIILIPHQNLNTVAGELHWLYETVKYLVKNDYLIEEDKIVKWNNDFNPEKDQLPVPDQLQTMIEEQIYKHPEYLDIILSAACFGLNFRVSTLADTIELSKLKTLSILEEIETETGFFYDEKANDDFYSFSSSFMLETIRKKYKITGSGPKTDVTPQKIREMHAQIALSLEKKYKSKHPQLVFNIAKHYFAAGEFYASEAFDYSLKACQASQAVYAYDNAKEYLEMAKELLLYLPGKKNSLDEEAAILELNQAHTEQNEETNALLAKKWIEYSNNNLSEWSTRLLLKIVRTLYNAKEFEKVKEFSEEIIQKASNDLEKAEGLQFKSLSYQYGDKESLEKAYKILNNSTLTNITFFRLKSRIMNSLAELYIRSEDSKLKDKGRDLFKARLQMDQNHNLKDEVGLARTYGGLGRYYLSEKKYDEAEYYFNKDLDLCIKLKDSVGESIMISLLGETALGKKDNKSALNYYKTALEKSTGNIGRYFAYAGILKSLTDNDDQINSYAYELVEILIKDKNEEIKKVPYAATKILEAIKLCENILELKYYQQIYSYVEFAKEINN